MNEFNLEEKANAYDIALKKAKQLLFKCKRVSDKASMIYRDEDIENMFPELKESEDEKLRKEMLQIAKESEDSFYMVLTPNKRETLIAWLENKGQSKKTSIWKHWKDGIAGNGNGIPVFLIKNGLTYSLSSCLSFECDYIELSELDSLMLEKQGEQKSVDKIESKFKDGQWYQCTKDFFGKGVTFNKNTAYYCAKEGCLQDEYGCHIAIVKDLYDNFKLWTIEDANDGDVLCLDYVIAIFKKYIGQEKCICYCSFCDNGGFEIPIENGEDNVYGCTDTTPANKEQRDLLFTKMHKAGYEWDEEKKELKNLKEESENCKQQIMSEMADLIKDYIRQKSAWTEEDEYYEGIENELVSDNIIINKEIVI